MKHLLTFSCLLLLTVKSFGQSADTLKTPHKNYKNTIQTNLLGIWGYFGLQYEHALNKDWSLSLIGSYRFPFKQLKQNASPGMTKVYSENFSLQAEVRYYLDKNKINNNGLYIAADIGYTYAWQYVPDYKSTSYTLKKYPWIGATAGYQLLIKKRLVVAAALSIQYGLKGDMYNSGPNIVGWSKMPHRAVYLPATINIGYAF